MAMLKQLTSRLTSRGGSGESAGKKVSTGDTVSVIRRYVLQETVEPLKQLGKALGFSLAGGLCAGIGAVIVLVGLLRVLQTETNGTFHGDWRFAPYLIVFLFALLAIAGCIVKGFGLNPSSKKTDR